MKPRGMATMKEDSVGLVLVRLAVHGCDEVESEADRAVWVDHEQVEPASAVDVVVVAQDLEHDPLPQRHVVSSILHFRCLQKGQEADGAPHAPSLRLLCDRLAAFRLARAAVGTRGLRERGLGRETGSRDRGAFNQWI